MEISNPRIAEIIVRQLRQQSLTAAEQLELQEWIDQSDQNRADYQQLRDPVKLNEWVQEYGDLHASIWGKVDVGIKAAATEDAEDNNNTLTIKRRRINWYIAAAAIIIVFLFSYGWLASLFNAPSKARPVSAPVALQDVAPGGDKATLTLADGSTIVLQDAADGSVATQGASRVSKSKNQLAYTSEGSSSKTLFNTLTTPSAGQFRVTLPDGSKVWLNNASALRYPTAFSGNTRQVELKGEAFFEVAKSPKPFTVKLLTASVQVLGTSFNIMAYDNENTINTTLVEGAVKVAQAEHQTLLAPGEQAQLDKQGQFKKEKVNVASVIAWKNGFFNFSHTDFQSAMRQLARWYDVEIIYQGIIPDKSFSGVIDRELPLTQVLKIFESDEYQLTVAGKKVIVSSPGTK